MNAQEMATKLGVTVSMAERMLKAMTKPEKKEKKAGRWFPGMPSNSNKVEVEIDVTIICGCCGSQKHEKRTVKQSKGSPLEMKTGTSLCENCPDFMRKFTKEQLISLVLVKEHPVFSREYSTLRAQTKIACKLPPAEVVTFISGDEVISKAAAAVAQNPAA